MISGIIRRGTNLISTTRSGVFYTLQKDLRVEELTPQSGAWAGWYTFSWQRDVWVVHKDDIIKGVSNA